MDILNIKGLGPKTLEYLNKLNLYTIQDLIEYYPYRYNVISEKNLQVQKLMKGFTAHLLSI